MRANILKIYGIVLAICVPYFLLLLCTDLSVPCGIYSTTGYLCPGCGTTRMLLSLAALRFGQAFSHNPVMFLLFFLWNGIALLCFWGRPAMVRNKAFLYAMLGVSVAALLIYGVCRNFS